MQGARRRQLGVLQFLGLGDVEGGIIRGEALTDRVEVDGESCCRRVMSEEVSRSSLKSKSQEARSWGPEAGPKLGQENNRDA